MTRGFTLFIAALALASATLFAQVADMNGQWEAVYNPPSGHVGATLYITQQGTTLKGNAETEGGEFTLSGSVDGNKFTLTYTRPSGGEMTKIVFAGTVDGDHFVDATAKVGSQAPVPLEADRTSH